MPPSACKLWSHIFVSVSVLKIQITLPTTLLYSGCLVSVHTSFRSVVSPPPKKNVGVFSRDVKRESSSEVNFSKFNTMCQNSADLFPGSIVLALLVSRRVLSTVKVAISGTFSDQRVGCRNFPDIRLLYLLCILVQITTSWSDKTN
jgi:hypothetical protein